MSQIAMEAEHRAKAVKTAQVKINRINQVVRKAKDGISDLDNIKDQMQVLIDRKCDRANDVNEMKDLFAQMDTILDKMEHL